MPTTPPLLPGSDAARALFPITEQTIFMNHASASPLSTRVVAAMEQWLAWWQLHGGRDDHPQPIAQIRAALARLIGASAEEIAIVGNTSEGLLRVAHGYPWQVGDALLTAETEFTANVYPWLPLAERGVEIIRVPARDHRVRLEDMEAALRAHPHVRLLVISYVEFATGYRNDLAALGQLCRSQGVHLCVDAIQGAGALPIDATEMGIDFLAAGGPKWLMGPIGAGLFYCRHELLSWLGAPHRGWLSTSDTGDYFRYDAPLSPTASRFEAGTLPWPTLMGLAASVETLLEVGIARIEAHVLELGDALAAGLQQRGYHVLLPDRQERGGTLSFRDPRRDASAVAAHLDAHDVTLSARGPWVRLSPHFYNTHAEVERVLALL